jgi:hypothetical protein
MSLPSTFLYSAANQKQMEIKEPTISKIEIPQADLDKLQRFLNSDKASPMGKEKKQRQITGICFRCGDIPDYILTKYYESVTLIEKYCSKCLDKKKEGNNSINHE